MAESACPPGLARGEAGYAQPHSSLIGSAKLRHCLRVSLLCHRDIAQQLMMRRSSARYSASASALKRGEHGALAGSPTMAYSSTVGGTDARSAGTSRAGGRSALVDSAPRLLAVARNQASSGPRPVASGHILLPIASCASLPLLHQRSPSVMRPWVLAMTPRRSQCSDAPPARSGVPGANCRATNRTVVIARHRLGNGTHRRLGLRGNAAAYAARV
jgi:hypothetical protein